MQGILIVDKPMEWTSFDVIAKLRGILGTRKLGHSGTLDPMATGVLPVFCGGASKAVDLQLDHTKTYCARLRLGMQTDTGDITGTVLETAPVTAGEKELLAVLPRFLGPQMQTPPMYSAVKINGQPLYKLAREGVTVERKARPIEILDIRYGGSPVENEYVLTVCCSKGTYIRTLCHDIGEKLGCHGCMEQLIRTRVGQFDRNGAHTLDEIAAIVGEGRLSEILVPVDEMFAALRSFATADDHAKKLAENGNPLKPAQIREIGETASGGDFAEDEEFRLYLDDGTFVGIYQYRPSQNLTRPVKLFLERT
jgi:tRNA pseudouridine55 synthase